MCYQLASVTINGQMTSFIYDGDGNPSAALRTSLVKKINPDLSKTIYIGGVYEVDKNAGGSVTRTVTYYPAGGAMRIDGTLYFVLKDHLGSASVVTDASGAVIGEQRYYPYGETRFTTGTMYTDKLYTGQREMEGLGIYHYQARFYSPRLGRFLSADTVVPNPLDPQDLNRFSYVRNNPIRYVDPSGHRPIEEGGGKRGCSDPKYCRDGRPKPYEELKPKPLSTTPKNRGGSNDPNSGGGAPSPTSTSQPDPTVPLSGGGGGMLEVGINIFGPEGEGGSVPLRYIASYDIWYYEDLMAITIHERYWIPGLVPPLMEVSTAGRSSLISTLRNGQQRKDILGSFEPGNIAYPDRLISRDVPIYFIGEENFPTQLVIRIVFGAENMVARTVDYQLPNIP